MKKVDPEPCQEFRRRISATISGWDSGLPLTNLHLSGVFIVTHVDLRVKTLLPPPNGPTCSLLASAQQATSLGSADEPHNSMRPALVLHGWPPHRAIGVGPRNAALKKAWPLGTTGVQQMPIQKLPYRLLNCPSTPEEDILEHIGLP